MSRRSPAWLLPRADAALLDRVYQPIVDRLAPDHLRTTLFTHAICLSGVALILVAAWSGPIATTVWTIILPNGMTLLAALLIVGRALRLVEGAGRMGNPLRSLFGRLRMFFLVAFVTLTLLFSPLTPWWFTLLFVVHRGGILSAIYVACCEAGTPPRKPVERGLLLPTPG